jgi:DNA-binding response OmpR family regulator
MKKKSILVVDDEKNIRTTIIKSLNPTDYIVHTAVNGEQALTKMDEEEFDLVFLDLTMPGLNGMEVLHRIRRSRPGTEVIMITAHGSVDDAVQAMKLGAADFIQKPFTPSEIKESARHALERHSLEETGVDYHSLIDQAEQDIAERNHSVARLAIRKAMADDPDRPEAYNLLGVLYEHQGLELQARKFYRAALDIDPTYEPASRNLERTTSWHPFGSTRLDPKNPEEDSKKAGQKKPENTGGQK